MLKTRFNYFFLLFKFGLTTIEKRGERGDMIQYYQINKSIDQKLQKQLIQFSGIRFHFFTNRIVNKWNISTEEIVSPDVSHVYITLLLLFPHKPYF